MTSFAMQRRSFFGLVAGAFAALVVRPALPVADAVAAEAAPFVPPGPLLSPWRLAALVEDYDANGRLWRAKHTYEMTEADGTVVEWEEVHIRNAKGDPRFSLVSSSTGRSAA